MTRRPLWPAERRRQRMSELLRDIEAGTAWAGLGGSVLSMAGKREYVISNRVGQSFNIGMDPTISAPGLMVGFTAPIDHNAHITYTKSQAREIAREIQRQLNRHQSSLDGPSLDGGVHSTVR